MSTTKHSGLCRCCLLEGYHRSLSDTYQFKGYANSYSDLIAKSLNIYLKKASGPLAEMTYQICEDCATKIKHIAVFRDQVLQCEEMFQKMYSNQTLRASELDIIKEEDPDSDVEIILKEEDTSLNLPDCQKEEADSNPVLDDDNIEDSDHDNDRHSDIQEEIPPEVSEKEQCNEGKTVETPAVTNDNRLSDDDDFYWEDSEMDTMISGPLLVPDTTPAPDVIDGKKTTRYSKRIKKQNDIKPKVKASSKKAKQKPNDQSEEKPKEKSKASSKKAQQNTNESSEENSILKASLLKVSYPPCPADYTKLINGNLKCKRCDKTTLSESAMNHHINIVHLKMARFVCKLCNGRFRSLGQVTKHKLNDHNIDDRVRCNACDTFFNTRRQLVVHINTFHMLGTKIKCPQCDYECYSNVALTKHSYAHGNREYNCKYCPKSFKRCSNLTQHLKIHTGDKKKVCKECGQAFVQKASLNYHMASLLKFSYPPCSADYTKLINGKLKCKRCDKTTRSEAAMNRHINIVHLKMPYHLCKLCNGRFRTRSQFTKHKLNVHNIDDRVRCNACDAFFDAKSRLQFHMLNFHKLGTRIKCPQCDYECYSNEALTKHSYAHGNREYNCKYCPKSFKRNNNLVLHMKIHTGDKNKVCKECGQAFVQKASLNYHMGKYHPEVPF